MSRPARLLLPASGYAPPDELRLRGLPANHGHETDPFGSALLEMIRRDQEALVYAATGKELDADLTVSAGHKHNDGDSRILWSMIGSWTCGEEADTRSREGTYVTSTAAVDLMVIPLRIPMNGATPIYTKVKFRFRVSNPSPTYATFTRLYLTGTFYKEDFSAVITAAPALAQMIQSSATRSYADEWIEGPTVEFTPTDLNSASGNLVLVLAGSITTAGDKATLWEVQAGWL